jgi:hypothetical protein
MKSSQVVMRGFTRHRQPDFRAEFTPGEFIVKGSMAVWPERMAVAKTISGNVGALQNEYGFMTVSHAPDYNFARPDACRDNRAAFL